MQSTFCIKCEYITKQEAHHKVGLGAVPPCLIHKRYRRYSSRKKFEDALDTILDNANKAVRCVNFGRFSNFDIINININLILT